MGSRVSLGLLAVFFSFVVALPAHAERLLASRADMTAILADDYQCGKTIPLTVRSGSEKAFTGERIELQRLLGGLRVVFGFECPEAENMIIDGEVAGKQVFKGAAAKDQDWLLIVLIEPQPNAISETKPSTTQTVAPASVAIGTTANSTPQTTADTPPVQVEEQEKTVAQSIITDNEQPPVRKQGKADYDAALVLAELSRQSYRSKEVLEQGDIVGLGYLPFGGALKPFFHDGGQSSEYLVAINEENGATIVAIEGTDINNIDLNDVFGTNLDAALIYVPRLGILHKGFYEHSLRIFESLKKNGVLEHMSSSDKDVFLTGHSLGGASSIVLASLLNEWSKQQHIDLASRIKVYTFGAAEAGDLRLERALLNTPTYNFQGQIDPVPDLASTLYNKILPSAKNGLLPGGTLLTKTDDTRGAVTIRSYKLLHKGILGDGAAKAEAYLGDVMIEWTVPQDIGQIITIDTGGLTKAHQISSYIAYFEHLNGKSIESLKNKEEDKAKADAEQAKENEQTRLYEAKYQEVSAWTNSGDFATALRILRPLAEKRYAPAQHLLGLFHYVGQGVPQDYKQAFKWFTLAAEQGNSRAQNEVGRMYETGVGVSRDSKLAMKWYTLAAEQGNSVAQKRLAKINQAPDKNAEKDKAEDAKEKNKALGQLLQLTHYQYECNCSQSSRKRSAKLEIRDSKDNYHQILMNDLFAKHYARTALNRIHMECNKIARGCFQKTDQFTGIFSLPGDIRILGITLDPYNRITQYTNNYKSAELRKMAQKETSKENEELQIIEDKLKLVIADVPFPSNGPSKKVVAEYHEKFFGEITARAKSNYTMDRYQKHPYLAGCIKGDGEYYICKTCAPLTYALAKRGRYAGAVSGAYYYSSKFSRSVETASGWRVTPITSRLDDLQKNDSTYFEASFAYASDKKNCGTVNYISDKCILDQSKSRELFNLYRDMRQLPEFVDDPEVKKIIGKTRKWCTKRIKEFY